MLKNTIKALARYLGYEIRKMGIDDAKIGFEIYPYFKSDGTFDYQKYKEIQITGNKQKIENVWVLEENISFLSNIHQGDNWQGRVRNMPWNA